MRWFIALALAAALTLPATAEAKHAKPTIVLVHGAFADASSWNPVIERLQNDGYEVLAPANPLRGVSADAAYIRSVLAQVPGPIVLVGHSYGGFVITNAATGNQNIKALVYIAAFVPDQGDSVQSLGQKIPGGMIGPDTLNIRAYPLPDGTQGQEGYIKPSVFRQIFAADLPARQTNVLAAAQRPASLLSLGEPSGPPAWKTIPSWYLLPTRDFAIGSDLERFMAKRAHARITEARGASHVVMLSQPDKTVDLIESAAR
jgi:pimeloyl-ACP methyl ester carboxylesterase